MEVGYFLKQVRIEKNISIRQLAQFTGISPAYISQIENGKRANPKTYVLRALFDGLGMNYDEFLSKLNYLHHEKNSPLTYEELRKLSLSHSTLEEQKSSLMNRFDLQDLLKHEQHIYFNGKLLNDKEKKKALALLRALFES